MPQVPRFTYLFTYVKLEETTRWAAIFYSSLTNREETEILKAECPLYEMCCEHQHSTLGKEIGVG